MTSAIQPEAAGPHPVDVAVGRRVRARRIFLGISQERLGKELGVTFQQVQKYERGTNRISASSLFEIARVLGVEPSYFFEEIDDRPSSVATPATGEGSFARRETLEFVRAYYRIPDQKTRSEINALIRSIADSETAGGTK
jgi:transcriptional regulator with XRE-family HTH domain